MFKIWLSPLLFWTFTYTSLASSLAEGSNEFLQPAVESANELYRCDENKSIPKSSLNDGYCDCIDGSDEALTPSCQNGLFYCENVGHFAVHIHSSRLRDGICDEECCDGSDELPGLCENTCKQQAIRREKLDKEIHDMLLKVRAI